HAGAVAVSPRRRGVQLDLTLPVELRRSPQCFAQDGGLDAQLVVVPGVLVVASTAGFEVAALGLYSLGARLDDLFNARPGEAALVSAELPPPAPPGQHDRDEDGLAGAVFIRREPRQPVAAVHEFFDGELHRRYI